MSYGEIPVNSASKDNIRAFDLPLNIWQHLIGLRAYLPYFKHSPLVDNPFSRSDIAMLHSCTTTTADAVIDAQKWGDLLLDYYVDHLSAQVSIFGQQILYQRLKTGLSNEAADRGFDAEITVKASKVANWLAAFSNHPLDCENLLDIGEPPQAVRKAGKQFHDPDQA